MQDKASISRRGLMQGAAVLGVSVLAGGACLSFKGKAFAQEEEEVPLAQSAQQYGFLVRASNCVNCQECVKACRRANETPADFPARRKVEEFTTSNLQKVFVSSSCMHCEEPACLTVCPAKAITKGEGGVVSVDADRCIGCKYCYQACPFSVPNYDNEGMDKCDCCLEAGVVLGEKPNCVKACKFRALQYGTLDELMAGSGDKAQRIESSTKPSFLLY